MVSVPHNSDFMTKWSHISSQRLKNSSVDNSNDCREVALEEPIHPEISSQDNPAPQNIPDSHFMVEDFEERDPCLPCIIL